MTFSFADDTPVQTSRGRHRRGRGYTPANRQNTRGGAQASSMSAQSASRQQHLHFSAQGWDSAPGRNNHRDDNSCAGSLEYSASSSVLSAEAEGSNESSFAEIMKVFDNEVNGSSEVREFIARQSQAAIGGGSGYAAAGGGQYEREVPSTDAAVQGWMQRVENRQAAALQQMRQGARARDGGQRQHPQQQQPRFGMADPELTSFSPKQELNYSINESSESDEVFEVDFDGNVLETIQGHDDDNSLPTNVTATSQSRVQVDRPVKQERYQAPSSFQNNTRSSAQSSSRSRTSRHVTPPPNSRRNHTATSPPRASASISPADSRHSKSSSEGSMDTPVPSSPPRNGLTKTRAKKPPSRGASAPKTRRGAGKGSDEQDVVELSNAFYTKSWMGEFTDSFDFNSEPGFPTP